MRLENIRYKPGWQFEMDRGFGRVRLLIMSQVLDTRNHAPTVLTTKHVWDERLVDAVHFPILVQDAVAKTELHEMSEWLYVDGRQVTDPHPELAR